jgi:UDP-N-acetylmuramate-alanine ligase
MKVTVAVFVLFLFVVAESLGQDEEEPKDLAPPAPKILAEEDKKQIDNAGNIRKQAQVAMLLMEEKLKEAEVAADGQNYRNVLNALGNYHALLNYSLEILIESTKKDKKAFRALKDFEISLRRHTPRLELIRRQIPYSYGWHVQKLIRIVRQARTRAIEPMYGEAI